MDFSNLIDLSSLQNRTDTPVGTSKFPFDLCPGIFACNDHPLPGTPLYNSKSVTGLPAQLVLCGSVGLLCFLTFCFARTRWMSMYSPRLRMKKHAPAKLPTSFLGWIWPVIKTPHSVVLEKVGLDAVVMLQFLLMGVKLFGLCGFFGTVVLLPVSRMGGDLLGNSTDPETPEEDEQEISYYSPSYLWVYLFFTYFFCFATFYFTFLNYRDYVRLRRQFLLRVAKKLPSRTVLVTGIPQHLRSDRQLATYFEQLGIGVVESVHVVRHVDRLMDYIKERAMYLRLLESAYTKYWGNPCKDTSYDPEQLLSEAERDNSLLKPVDWAPDTLANTKATTTITASGSSHSNGGSSTALPSYSNHTNNSKKQKRPMIRPGFMGLLGKPVDAIEYYTKKYNEIDEIVQKARKHGKFVPTSVGFVTFEHSVSACVAAQVLIDSTPFRLHAELAAEPRNVLWENIAMHGRERTIRKVVIFCILMFLVFFWVFPISYFSALTSERSLQNYFPWLMDLASKNKILHQIVVGFLPTLAVVVFMAILPVIVNVLSVIEGFQSRSEAEESSFSKHFFFLLFNLLLVFTVTSTLFKTLTDMIEDPKQIANILASSLGQVAPFFVNYTVLQCLMLLPLQMLQIGAVILQLFWRLLCRTPRDYAEVSAPRMFNYGWGYPAPVFMFIVLLVYSTSAPIILIFGTLYYCFAYVVFKYQLLYVFFHPYEVAGRMWPRIFSRIIIGLLLFETMSSGLFLLRKAYPLAVLCWPLILITIVFKLTMDAAYLRSTRVLPLQLLTQRLGIAETTVVDTPTVVAPPPNGSNNVDPQPSTSERSTRLSFARDLPNRTTLRRRRTVLDQDDYVAAPTVHTDYRQPPMTLVDGILNKGMKKYGHPALQGQLPHLWLPVSAKSYRRSSHYSEDTTKPVRFMSNDENNERQPLLYSTSPQNGVPVQQQQQQQQQLGEEALIEDEEASSVDSSSSEEDETAARAMYYHHPERRSRAVLPNSFSSYNSRNNYGAV
ncbi:hypothetical protein BDB00DRAFT_628628 [Zychaea mexicana]|uniref:uncharacterized protein n=1 Tax=Zychaea mexicana TaxID=64656 RepID=UPI0022FE46C9|nr:uncharacterized protein BDB00DRAFT_628628 [Zychaea mexicana]KAI9497544.1 hypothetical protein BDB00DRAFT_628628 [Zychaea mexicana]